MILSVLVVRRGLRVGGASRWRPLGVFAARSEGPLIGPKEEEGSVSSLDGLLSYLRQSGGR